MLSLAQILIMLTAVLGMYSNPAVMQNATLKAQVDSLAVQAIQETQVALAQPQDTQLGVTPISPIVISTPTSTDATPIVVTVNPPVQQPVVVPPVVSPPVLGANPATPVKVLWYDGVQKNVMVSTEQFAYDATEPAKGINQSSTIIHLSGSYYFWDSATMTVNGQTYDLPITHPGGKNSDIFFGILGLQSGQSYPYSLQINAGNNYATESDTISIP